MASPSAVAPCSNSTAACSATRPTPPSRFSKKSASPRARASTWRFAPGFPARGGGAVTVAPMGNAALVVDSVDWAEADPGSAQTPMCFFSSGMLADFLGRLSGEPVAVMEVECRSRNDGRCRFLSASPDTLNAVYAQMTEGRDYAEVLGAGR